MTEKPGKSYMDKLKKLKKILRDAGTVAIAFSGGVDSSFLLKVAHDELGDSVTAVTARANVFPDRESSEADEFCRMFGIKHIKYRFDVAGVENFSNNPPDRCYHCKKALLGNVCQIAKENGLAVVVEGTNIDDEGDYRPGMKAVTELGIRSPLRECGMTKDDIRMLSKYLGLPTWDKPSFACLASRFVYGEPITVKKLLMVENAENMLFHMGFRQFRVRVHGSIARIEILPDEFGKLMENGNRKKITEAFKEYGFDYVTMDLCGYRTGSMNEPLIKHVD